MNEKNNMPVCPESWNIYMLLQKITNNVGIIDSLTEFAPDEPPPVGGTVLDPAGGLATTIDTRRVKLISRNIWMKCMHLC